VTLKTAPSQLKLSEGSVGKIPAASKNHPQKEQNRGGQPNMQPKFTHKCRLIKKLSLILL
jgi:hypothetical protein